MNETTNGSPISVFKALSEELRLRILGVLDVAEFSVVELTDILETPQSTISRHLARLREAGLVRQRRQGTLAFYSRPAAARDSVAAVIEDALNDLKEADGDREAAHRVLDQRRRMSEAYFDQMVRRYSDIVEPGGSWTALAGALAMGYDDRVVADIGAGDGELTLRLAVSARTVYAIDQSKEMVRHLEQQAEAYPNVSVRRGDFEDLPVEDGVCDVVIASQVLHHCPRPRRAVGEAGRILKPGGRLILIDLAAHDMEWPREKLADHWLGFDPQELKAWFDEVGFENVLIRMTPTPHENLTALTISGRKRKQP